MNKDLENYVKIYKGALDKSFCSDAVKSLEDKKFTRHSFYNPISNSYFEHEDELETLYGWKQDPNYSYLVDKISSSFNTYTKELEFDWFDKAGSFCNYRYNRYLTSTRMAEHCDHIHDIFDGKKKGVPILTFLAFLNDDFEGGDLVMFKDKKMEISTGDIMVFPSNFLYPHRVEKVTQGVRYSIATWAW